MNQYSKTTAFLCIVVSFVAEHAFAQAEPVSFEREVFPLLEKHCSECHHAARNTHCSATDSPTRDSGNVGQRAGLGFLTPWGSVRPTNARKRDRLLLPLVMLNSPLE